MYPPMTAPLMPTDPDAPSLLPAVVEHAINWLCHVTHAAMVDKGWYQDGDRNVAEVLCLIHSEVSEALEECRKPDLPLDAIYFGPGAKPEGFPVEIADLLLRAFDLCGHRKIPLAKALALKMAYNRTRPHRHGWKRC